MREIQYENDIPSKMSILVGWITGRLVCMYACFELAENTINLVYMLVQKFGCT
jgi:hypothetical protein